MTKMVETAGRTRLGLNPLAALVDGVLNSGGLLAAWQQRANERTALASLDDRLLRDIGIDRQSAAVEAKKPFWRS
ncbi:MAG: DUF1127 domain-containing protein [Minwuia sp.]|uniref:DUF1127 domain-containing protein n=1 Tax=Minwuia sp. TaxID=2493630 RepID=UPI003A88BC86